MLGKKSKFPNYLLLKLVALLLSLFIILMLVAFFFFPQIWYVGYLKVGLTESKYPQLYLTLEEREVERPDTTSGFREYFFNGFSLKSPWQDEVKKEQRTGVDILFFGDNKAIFFFHSKNILSYHENLMSGDLANSQKLIDFLGISGSSNYELTKLILAKNPNNISIFNSKEETLADSIMIPLKLTLVVPFKGGIYNFCLHTTPNLKGFQYGDPSVSKGIKLQFFDEKDQEFNIALSGASQKDIDFILSSIRFTK